MKNQEAAEAAIDEETQKEATEELNAEEKVNKELAEAQKTIEEQHDKYLRLSAEFDNYRKRTMRKGHYCHSPYFGRLGACCKNFRNFG